MIRIGQKRGTGAQSKTIEIVTDGPYSHTLAQFLEPYEGFDCHGERVKLEAGDCVEAWDPFVRCIHSLREGHEIGTQFDFYDLREPLSAQEFNSFAKFICRQIGKPYDWPMAEAFLPTGRMIYTPPNDGLHYENWDKWICSVLIGAALERANRKLFNFMKVWKIHPNLVPESSILNPNFQSVAA